jgi:hypothetical protein
LALEAGKQKKQPAKQDPTPISETVQVKGYAFAGGTSTYFGSLLTHHFLTYL